MQNFIRLEHLMRILLHLSTYFPNTSRSSIFDLVIVSYSFKHILFHKCRKGIGHKLFQHPNNVFSVFMK